MPWLVLCEPTPPTREIGQGREGGPPSSAYWSGEQEEGGDSGGREGITRVHNATSLTIGLSIETTGLTFIWDAKHLFSWKIT